MMGATLRVVSDKGKSKPRRTRKRAPTTVAQAVKDGSPRDVLMTLRARIAQTIDAPDTPPRDLAALSRRLVDIDKELRDMEATEKEESEYGAVSEDEEWSGV